MSSNNIKEIVDKTEKPISTDDLQVKVFTSVLYPDSKDYNCDDVLNKLIQFIGKYDGTYAYILHDKDYMNENIYDDLGRLSYKIGETKKPHYHFVGILPYYKYINDICCYVGIEDRWLEKVKPKKLPNALLYLTHIKYPEKYQYSPSDITTDIKSYINQLYIDYKNNNIRDNIIKSLNIYLNDMKIKVSKQKMYDYLINGLGYDIKEYKSYYLILKDLLNEHNYDYEIESYNDRAMTNGYIKGKEELENMFRLADTFGVTTVTDDKHNQYVIMRKENKK